MNYRATLLRLRTRGMRRGMWFKLLTTLERAQIDLTVRLVTRVQSDVLARVLDHIISKLSSALQSPILKAIKSVGVQCARKLSAIAQSWGNTSAKGWGQDWQFARFLAILDLNAPGARRGRG